MTRICPNNVYCSVDGNSLSLPSSEIAGRSSQKSSIPCNHESATADKFPRMNTNGEEIAEPRIARMTRILARSALERKSSVGATLLYGVWRPGAALGFLKSE